VNVSVTIGEPYPDHVDAGRSCTAAQSSHMGALGKGDRIDRITGAGSGSDLDHNPLVAVHCQKIDFTRIDDNISTDNPQPVSRQEAFSDPLADRP